MVMKLVIGVGDRSCLLLAYIGEAGGAGWTSC